MNAEKHTRMQSACVCVCVCHLTSSLSPPPCRVSSTLPLWQEVAAAAQRNKDTQQRQILSQHTVTSESLMKTCDRGRKGWNTERRGKSSLQIFTRFDLQLKWKLKISVDWTIKEQVCLKMTEQLHSAIVGCFFFNWMFLKWVITCQITRDSGLSLITYCFFLKRNSYQQFY